MRNRLQKLLTGLRDKARRALFVETQIETLIPFQIRAMREARGWTQKQLATRSGMGQGRISVLESLGYEGAVNVKTLVKLAEAFDVGLIVRFAPFSEIAQWSTKLSKEHHVVPDFDSEWKAATETANQSRVTEKQVVPATNVIEAGNRFGIRSDLVVA